MYVINVENLTWGQIVLEGTGQKVIMIPKEHIAELGIFEAEPVIHAYWIHNYDPILGDDDECSNCHIHTCGQTPYCPICGAKMDVKKVSNNLCETCKHNFWHDPECDECKKSNNYKYYEQWKGSYFK